MKRPDNVCKIDAQRIAKWLDESEGDDVITVGARTQKIASGTLRHLSEKHKKRVRFIVASNKKTTDQ